MGRPRLENEASEARLIDSSVHLSDMDSSHGSYGPADPHGGLSGLPEHIDQPHQDRRAWHKISCLGATALVLGTVVQLGAVGVLLFIWIEASRATSDEQTTPSWSNMAFSVWTTRVVTICTAAMRVAIASQAAVSMAMVAALFLESAGSSAFDLAALSLFRATSPSPLSLLGHLRFHQASASLYSVLVLLTASLAVVSQFTSTILLSDFATANITRVFEATDVPYVSSVYSGSSYFMASAPAAYWRFAEHSGPPIREEAFVDTGPSIRAAIPWSDESRRLRLQSYDGPAVVFDTRSFCVRPNLANVTIPQPNARLPHLMGNITLDNAFLPIRRCNDRSFECTQDYDQSSPWVVPFACAIGATQYTTVFGNLGSTSICDVDIRHQPTLPSWLPAANHTYTRAFGVMVSHEFDNFAEFEEPDYENLVLGDRGAWKTLANPDGRGVFSFSLCFSKQGLLPSNVTISGSPAVAEPEVGFVPNPGGGVMRSEGSMDPVGAMDTLAVRRYLGVTDEGLSLRARGLLELDASRPQRNDTDSMMDGFRLGSNTTLLIGSFTNFIDETPNMAHERTAAVIHDVLRTTDNPAYAVQALATQSYLMQYYDRAFAFDTAGPATYARVESVLIPVRRSGLYGTLAVVVLHLAVVATVVSLFLARTRVSLLGNYWQAVAQVVSNDTEPLLRRADGLRDTEVEALIARDLMARGVVRERKNGRREFGVW